MADAKADASGAKSLNIEITSDTICPWCFVGKRRLEKALAKLDPTKVKVNIHWKPFELDPTLPVQSVSKMERYTQKFGEARMKQMLPHMIGVGKQEGINFSYGGRTGNTRNSHRLITWAAQQGKEDEIVEKLFNYYFEQERDITDLNTLVEAATAVGLDGTKARAMLESDQLRDVVNQEIQEAYHKGVSGVPSFDINGRYTFSGAQDVDFFLEVFRKLGVHA